MKCGLWVVLGVGGCFFGVGFFFFWMYAQTEFSFLFPPTAFPSPSLSKKSRNAMPLVFTNMYLPHVEHLCAGFGMQHVAILAKKIQNLWEMPYSSGKEYHIIY